MTDAKNDLERTVKDSYLVYFERKSSGGSDAVSAAEAQQRFEQLVQRAEQLLQQYGTEKFSYRKFEYVKAIAATIKQPEIIETLIKDGYVVKEQGKFTASKALYQPPSQNHP